MRPPATPRERSTPEPTPARDGANTSGTHPETAGQSSSPSTSQSSSPAHEPVTDLSDLPPALPGRRALARPGIPLLMALALWAYAVRPRTWVFRAEGRVGSWTG
ncbi:hypothetical protein AB0L17_36375 [Streptomyces cellulosae]